MKLLRNAGATSEIWQIFIADSSSTTGAGLAGLTSASAGLTAYYHRDTDTTATAISLVTMTVGTFTSGGFKEIDATNMPGWYQFCPPNAALASGAKSCAFHLKGATNMAPLPIEVDLAPQITTYAGNTPQTGDAFARLGAPAGASVSADVAAVEANAGAIKAKTDNLPTTPAATGDAMTLTGAYDFAKGTVAMPEAYAADGAAATPEQILYMIWSLFAERDIASTTLTAKKLDGTTTAMTFALNDATNPTTQTRTG